MTEIKQPAENVEPVAWLDPGTEDVITQTRKTEWERFFGEGGKLKAASYTVPLYAAQTSGQEEA